LAITPPGFIGGGLSIQKARGPASPAEETLMKSTMTALAAVLAAAALGASPAVAQRGYGPQGGQQSPQQTGAPATQDAKSNLPQPKISRGAQKALLALEAAVKANNGADVTAKAAEANAVATTADDKYMVGALEYKYAAAAKDDALRAQAIEQMMASGFAGAPKATLYTDLGATYRRLKQPQRAVEAYQQAVQLTPNDVEAVAGLAETKADLGQAAEALALIQKGIALQSAGGAKAPESWYKRALQIAWKSKLPGAVDVGRAWVAAYPSSDSWVNALIIYQNVGSLDADHTLDLMRLKRAVKVLSPSDYFNYGQAAVDKGFPGEAKAILDQGFAANLIDKNNSSFSQLYALATQRSKGDRESLPAAPTADANAHRLIVSGDAYYGYGDFAKAAEFYRAALTKPGVEADVANLHLGMALAAQGDKAGAAAALQKVGGSYADLGKFWLLSVAATA
jgi:tetratricopeptide (TPR) repeat protein